MKNNFYKTVSKNGVCFYRNEVLDELNFINHAFSTRIGGVSKNAYSSLNLGVNTPDEKDLVLQNFELFSDAIGINSSKMVLAQQVHSPNIKIVTKDDCGKGVTQKSDIESIDALITAEKGVALATFYADCTPFLIADIKGKAVASVHSGWRGTLLKIVQKTVLAMVNNFGCVPDDLICVSGPSIKQCHFEVGKEVYDEFVSVFGSHTKEHTVFKNDKFYIDTDALNHLSLTEVGVKKENIDICSFCTVCNKNTFFSHRGDGGTTGRMCAVIELN